MQTNAINLITINFLRGTQKKEKPEQQQEGEGENLPGGDASTLTSRLRRGYQGFLKGCLC